MALTRAKRVLRVVGDIKFFRTLGSESTLHKLERYARTKGLVHKKQVDDVWRPPDWTRVTTWKPTMTSKFHHCLKGMNQMDKHLSFNTLLAVATRDLQMLCHLPGQRAHWNMSALKKYFKQVQILWVAKEGEGRPMAEAHFAGTRQECLQYQQQHPVPPSGMLPIKKDMSGIDYHAIEASKKQSSQIDVSWAITNDIQGAVLEEIENLPDGCFVLDPDQEEVVATPPPLLLESRSGTGKTNVLFQHAVCYARNATGGAAGGIKPICFVTVSPRLQQELHQRYHEISEIENVVLPSIKFFSLRELLDGLLKMKGLKMAMSETCSFLEFVSEYELKTHNKPSVDLSLAENEIGGVIMGLLDCVSKKLLLTRHQYVNIIDKRSNVPKSDITGKNKRSEIYDIFEQYHKWKAKNYWYDINDIVLKLICKGTDEIFQAGTHQQK